MDIVEGKLRVVFSQVPYNLATEEAERVGVDHIAKETVATGTHTSAVTDHLSVHYGAIRMLHTRIQFVVDYLRAVQAGWLGEQEVFTYFMAIGPEVGALILHCALVSVLLILHWCLYC